MSVVACIKVYDGVVLGADSATQIQITLPTGEVQFIKSYQNAQKIFRIGNLKVCALCYGLGNIGNRSILSVITEFNNSLHTRAINAATSIEHVSNELLNFIKGLYDVPFANIPEQNRPVLGFFISGFSETDHLAQEWEFVLPNDLTSRQVRPIETFGIDWRGISLPFFRLYKGYDPNVLLELCNTFHLDQNQVMAIVNKYESKVPYNGMPLQDAIEFLNYVLLTSINYTKFEVGVPACSEPIDMVMITTTEYKELNMKSPNHKFHN
jgi:hypothetical protein